MLIKSVMKLHAQLLVGWLLLPQWSCLVGASSQDTCSLSLFACDVVQGKSVISKAPKSSKAPGETKAPSSKAPKSSKAPGETKAPSSKAPKSSKAPGETKAPSYKTPKSSKAPSERCPSGGQGKASGKGSSSGEKKRSLLRVNEAADETHGPSGSQRNLRFRDTSKGSSTRAPGSSKAPSSKAPKASKAPSSKAPKASKAPQAECEDDEDTGSGVTICRTNLNTGHSETLCIDSHDIGNLENSVQYSFTCGCCLEPTGQASEACALAIPNQIEYAEGQSFALSGAFGSGSSVTPGPFQTSYLEVNLTALPNGTTFLVDGVEISDFDGEWLLIPVQDISRTTIQSSSQYSGAFVLPVRYTVRNTAGGEILESGVVSDVPVRVLPVAQCSESPFSLELLEDGNVSLADIASSLNITDTGNATVGNNDDPETFVEFRVTIPANNATIAYSVEDTTFGSISIGQTVNGPNGTLISLSIDAETGAQIFTIRSATLPNGRNSSDIELLGTSLAEREQIESDLRTVLSLFTLSIRPEHNDLDGSIRIGTSAADVNLDMNEVSIASCEADTTLIVRAVSDQPGLNTTDLAPALAEIGQNISLCFEASFVDPSENLVARIELPVDARGDPIGELVYEGTIPNGVTLTYEGAGVWVIETQITDPSLNTGQAREDLLNEVLCSDPSSPQLVFVPDEFFYGSADIGIVVTSNETATGVDQVAVQSSLVSGNLTVNYRVPASVQFNENTNPNLNSLGVNSSDYLTCATATGDRNIEISLSNRATGDIKFFLGTQRIDNDTSFIDGNWLIVPESDFDDLVIEPFPSFSGVFEINVRGTVRASSGGALLESCDEELILANVLPVAVCPTTNPQNDPLTISEDAGPVNFGQLLLDASYDTVDKANDPATSNNDVGELFLEISITFQADTQDQFFNITDSVFGPLTDGGSVNGTGGGTGIVSLNIDGGFNRVYTIRSAVFPNGVSTTESELLASNMMQVATAQSDIVETLRGLIVQFGPEHTDTDNGIRIDSAVADVNFDVLARVGSADIQASCSKDRLYVIAAIADNPSLVDLLQNPAAQDEDGDNVPICFLVNASNDNFDFDNSEVLTVRIDLPRYEVIRPRPSTPPIGQLRWNGNTRADNAMLPTGVTITRQNGGENWLIEATGSTPQIRQDRLNSVLCSNTSDPESSLLRLDPLGGWAGVETINITVVSAEENTNGDQIEVLNATATTSITITVNPIADLATIEAKGNAIGLEDVSLIFCVKV